MLRDLQRKPITHALVVLVSYEGLRQHKESLSNIEWTAVCLDEGQKIRNPTAEVMIMYIVLSYSVVILLGSEYVNAHTI